MEDTGSTDSPPPFEKPFRGEDVEQRIYGTMIGTREPITASVVAERVDCDPKTARKYLNWFATLGIVTRHTGRPDTYERNDAYFEWRRIDQLATDRSIEELRERVRELTARISEYESAYGAETPAAVDAVEEAGDERSIDEVYSDLTDWETARQERKRHERARQQLTGIESGQATS